MTKPQGLRWIVCVVLLLSCSLHAEASLEGEEVPTCIDPAEIQSCLTESDTLKSAKAKLEEELAQVKDQLTTLKDKSEDAAKACMPDKGLEETFQKEKESLKKKLGGYEDEIKKLQGQIIDFDMIKKEYEELKKKASEPCKQSSGITGTIQEEIEALKAQLGKAKRQLNFLEWSQDRLSDAYDLTKTGADMAMEHAQSGYDELQTWVTTAAAPAVAEHANLAGSHARKLYDAYAAQHVDMVYNKIAESSEPLVAPVRQTMEPYVSEYSPVVGQYATLARQKSMEGAQMAQQYATVGRRKAIEHLSSYPQIGSFWAQKAVDITLGVIVAVVALFSIPPIVGLALGLIRFVLYVLTCGCCCGSSRRSSKRDAKRRSGNGSKNQ